MRPTIPKNIDDYKNIEADDLSLRAVNTEEQERIERFVKRHNGKSTLPILLAFFVGTAVPVLALSTMKEMDTELLMFALCFGGLFYVVAFLTIKNRLKATAPLKGVQTGLANGVWSYKAGNKSRRSYYIDVVFPDEKRRIKKVSCLKDDYEDVNQGDEILVFTYDKRRAYGCRVK